LTIDQPAARFGAACLLRQGRNFDLTKASPAIPVDLKTVAGNDYLTVKVSVDPSATYTWYYSSFEQTNWTRLPNQKWPIFDFSDPLVPKEYGGFLRLAVFAKGSVQTIMFRVGVFSDPLSGFKIEPPKLFINTHPSDVSVKHGGDANFSVFATGIPVRYDWYYQDPTTKQVSLKEQSSSPYWSSTDVGLAQEGKYFAVVTDYWGKTEESLRALLTVIPGAKTGD
jgi:hypothetical protein